MVYGYCLGKCGAASSDVVFILDSSTSVGKENFQKVLTFVKDFLSDADIDSGNVRVAVVIYSSKVQVQFYLNRYRKKEEVLDAIDRIPYIAGSTNTYGGLNTMKEVMFSAANGDRANVPNLAMLITDGVSNINAFKTIPEAESARAQGIHIYSIGIGLADTSELKKIASAPSSENSFTVREFDELEKLKHKVFEHFCPGNNRLASTCPMC